MLIIVTATVLWLITGGMLSAPALGVAAGIGVIACEIVARLSGRSGGWSPWLMRPLT